MEKKKTLKKAVLCLGILLAAWLFLSYLLPLVLPFFLGLLAALAVQPLIAILMKKCGFSRGAASFCCVLALYLLIAGLVYLLLHVGLRELSDFLPRLPALAGQMAVPLARLEKKLYAFADTMPDGIGAGLHAGLERFFAGESELGGKLYSWLFGAAGSFLELLPRLSLFLVTSILASFMLSAQLPRLLAAAKRRVSAEKWKKLLALRTRCRDTLGSWLLAQAKLMGITFCIVCVGFLLLGVAYAPMAAFFIALVDALPVLGTGLILIPWAIVSFLQEKTGFAVGLLVIYGTAALTRQAIEPRLVGKQIGLEPIVTLAAMYVGFRIMGVGGMLLFPLAAIFIKQLWDHSGLRKTE